VNWLDQGELRRIALAPDRQRSSLDSDLVLDLDPDLDLD